LDLLPKSREIAHAFRDAIKGTVYFQNRTDYDTANSIHYDILLEYGEKSYLSGMAIAPDASPVLEALFGLDAKYVLPEPQQNLPTYGNMTGSLGLIVEMLDQSNQAFDDQLFRDCIMYGICSDFKQYQPSKRFEPIISHWRMFQLREYYVYALYELWIFLLDTLRRMGPLTFDMYRNYLDEGVDFSHASNILGLMLPEKKPSQIATGDFVRSLLHQSNVICDEFEEGCHNYTNRYDVIANEKNIQRLLQSGDFQHQEDRVLLAWCILASIYIRLKSIHLSENHNAWYWAKEGGARRRSMALFIKQMDAYVYENKSLLQTFEWLFRDYVLAQHTITALEKWRQRNVNTFHFSYENGLFEWMRMDVNTFTADRFFQAYSMIRDLGIVELDQSSVPFLTTRGKETLQRVLEKLGG
jgi:hypothetical protein